MAMQVRDEAQREEKKSNPGVGMSDRDITPFLRNSIPLEFTSWHGQGMWMGWLS